MGCGSSREQLDKTPSPPPIYTVSEAGVEDGGVITNNNNNHNRGGLRGFKTLAFSLQKVNPINSEGGKAIADKSEIDVFKWEDKKQPQLSSRTGSRLDDLDEEDEPEVVSLHPTFVRSLEEALLRSSEAQTDPVTDEAAFDWDLSDRTDCETQTTPPTRATSTVEGVSARVNEIQLTDAIVQTDQRLTFLLNRSTIRWRRGNSGGNPADSAGVGTSAQTGNVGGGGGGGSTSGSGGQTFADASCQTYVEVTTVGVQVDPSEFVVSGFSAKSTARSTRRRHHYNLEDDSDFSDADISTVHPKAAKNNSKSAKKRLIRGRDGTYLGSPNHSDPDEIILASEAVVDSPTISPVPTQSDAGFQVNMEVAAVAASISKDEISSPVG